MKPNLIVVQPPHAEADSIVESFCETMCGTHYVYLIRHATGFREDSPAGVRFLNLSPSRLPGFGEVESVLVVDGDEDLLARVRSHYPAAHLAIWSLEENGGQPFELIPSLSGTIIRGEFGQTEEKELARAM